MPHHEQGNPSKRSSGPLQADLPLAHQGSADPRDGLGMLDWIMITILIIAIIGLIGCVIVFIGDMLK